MGGVSNWGIRKTLDVTNRFVGHALPTYLRVTAPAASGMDDTTASQYGFQASASSGEQVTQDILIAPPPQVTEVPMRDIGLNSAILSFGARRFLISHTWVLAQQQANNYLLADGVTPDFYRVFRDASVLGLLYNNRLFKIESCVHEDIASQSWNWNLVCNAAEQTPTI